MRRRALLLILVALMVGLALPAGLARGDAIPLVTPVQPVGDELPEGVFVIRAYYDTAEDIQRLAGFDVFEYNNLAEQYVLVAVDRAGFRAIEALGLRAVVDLEETAYFTHVPVLALGQLAGIPGYACYRTVEETYAAAAEIAALHPTLATWSDVGNSWEKATVTNPDLAGYDLMVLTLTNSALTGAKPRLLITASIHAREYTPAELTTRFAEYLVNNYGVDADATWLLDHHEIHLIFQANPDGRKKAEAGASWRKNTDRDDGCSSSYGTDLNRNFGYQWGTGGSSAASCDETYRGPSAGSEPETQAIQNYLKAVFPDQRGTGAAPADTTGVYLDLHSAAGLVIWPWGYTTTNTPNSAQLFTLGRKFAYFNGYTPDQIADQLYVASGGSVDYSYGELGIASFAFELGTQFFQSCDTFNNTVVPANLPALVYAAKVARTPYMTPLGPDALSLAVTLGEVVAGNPVNLSATIDDTLYSTRNGSESTQNIAAAEYYIDIPPWQTGAVPLAMTAADGSFNNKVESVTASAETTGLTSGRHIIFVRGRDTNNNWGAFSAVFFTIASSTAVDLAYLTAQVTAGSVTLAWETVSETDNVGFNIYRADSEAGPWLQVNAALIPAAAPGSSEGHVYTWVDASAGAGPYVYALEDVALNGTKTRHSTITMTAAVPNAVGLSGFGAATASAWPALGALLAVVVAAAGAAAVQRRKKD